MSSAPVTRRAAGRRLLAELAGISRQKAAVIEQLSVLQLRLASLEQEQAAKLAQIGEAEVELSTARKRREPPAPPVPAFHGVDDLTRRRVDRALRKVLP